MTGNNEVERAKNPEVKPEGNDAKAAQNAAANKMLDDTTLTKYLGGNTGNSNEFGAFTSNAGGRVLYATGEGLAKAPVGIWNAAVHNLEHPDELLHTAATGAVFGLGMRLLLPKAGAAKALVGTAMSYFFIKDAAMPIVHGWKDAAAARDMNELHAASAQMGDGLGHFAVNSAIGMGTGMLAEGATGALLERTATGRKWEAWKDHTFNSEETAVGRFFKWSERTADNTSDAVARRLLQRRLGLADELTLAQKLEAIRQVNKHGMVEADGRTSRVDLDEILAHRKRYRAEDFTQKIDGLLAASEQGQAVLAADAGHAGTSARPVRALRLNEGGEPGTGGTGTGGGAKPTDGGHTTPPAGKDGGIVVTDAAAKGGTQPRPTGDMNHANVGDMAVSMRQAAGKVTKEDIVVAQATEDIAGPISSTMRSGKAPLDEGHFSNNDLLLALTDQIHTADDYRAAGMLLDHFRTANQQLEIAARGRDPRFAIHDLNQYSRSVHAQLLKALDDNGIPRSVVRGSNSPLFTIRDSDGAGPYTIPAIKDPATGKPVTDAAVVTYPREYQYMEGVHTSGVYSHELGHDLIYGDLLRFPKDVRDSILTQKVVGDVMKANGIADVEIQVPGAEGGVMKKSEFFVQLLKAQANENTADMFGTSIDPNTGLSLAVLLGSLRKPAGSNPAGPGLLETRSMYGKDMVEPEMHNTLGIEPHGIDRWRLKLAAETLRELGGGSKPVADYAAKLDGLADTMSRPGSQYVWANTDNPGQFVAIPIKEWDAIIPALVKAQFNTKLEALNGHTLKDIAPNIGDRFTRVDSLADQMADAAVRGQSTIPGFKKTDYRIEEVFSAGLSGWMKAVAKNAEQGGNLSPTALMERINNLSADMRTAYRNDMPEAILTQAAKDAPVTSKLANLAVRPLGALARFTGRAAEGQPRLRERMADWTPRLGAYAGVTYFGPKLESSLSDILQTQKVQNQMLNPQPENSDQQKR